MRNPLLRPLVPLALCLWLGVGCVRAPPPMVPYATGGVAQAQQSGGQLVGAIGGSTDVWTSQSLSASVDGRLKLGTHFDLGLGGAYGSGGLPKTWAGRFSPRWYTNDLDAPLAIAMELGLSAGQYEGGGVRISSTQQAVPRFRVDFGSVDLPRAGTLLAQGAGRLIRSSADRGVVAVLDSRLATARYRVALLERVPPMKRTLDRDEVVSFLEGIAAVDKG